MQSPFAKCKLFTLDPFWLSFFSSCENKKFPSGIKFDAKTCTVSSTSSVGSTTFDLSPFQNAQSFAEGGKIFTQFIEFLRECGIESQRNMDTSTGVGGDKSTPTVEEIEKLPWRKLKKEHREKLLYDYVLSLKSKYKLTTSETSALDSVITVGIKLGCISANNIEYDEEKEVVTNIDNLNYNSRSKEFSYEINTPVANTKNVVVRNTKSKLIECAEKYVKSYNSRPIFNL